MQYHIYNQPSLGIWPSGSMITNDINLVHLRHLIKKVHSTNKWYSHFEWEDTGIITLCIPSTSSRKSMNLSSLVVLNLN